MCRERGAGSPRAQCKVIREAFHGHREGERGNIRNERWSKTGGGESLREQDSIFISILVFIVSLRGGGRRGRGFGYDILSDCLRAEETERGGCVSACESGVCEPKKGSCFLACMLVCMCVCFHLILNALPERERVMCVECVRGGEIKLAA